MITLTKLSGPVFALNSDLIEQAEATPETVITLVDGRRYVVRESLAEVVDRIRRFRASIVALANGADDEPQPLAPLRLIKEANREP